MRARNLKPSLFKNEILGTADPLLTILFEGLWCEADREGRLEDRPLRIKAEVFPYRESLDIHSLLSWLETNDFIQWYTVNGVALIQVKKFLEHQHPHKNEVASNLPPLDEASTAKVRKASVKGKKSVLPNTVALGLTPSSLTPDSLVLTPDSLVLTDGLPPKPGPSAAPPVAPSVDAVFDHWKREWNHPSAKLDAKRRKRIEARLKDFGYDQLCDAISGFKHSPWHNGTDPRGNGVVYDGIETLLRDTAQVETGLQLFNHPPRPPPKVEQLSPVDRVKLANGVNRDERVVSEQGGSSFGGMDSLDRDVREPVYTGFRRLGS